MITEAILTTKVKMIGVSMASAVLLAADTQTTSLSYEDITLKVALALAVVVLYRLLLKDREEHKTEMKALRDKQEDRLVKVIEDNTKSNEKVCELTEESANYFRAVTRIAVDEKLKGHQPTIP
jgi:membrane protein implicated in regulation of membrane protease activity